MNGNAELLNFVYQNAEMGVNTMKQIVTFFIAFVLLAVLPPALQAQRKSAEVKGKVVDLRPDWNDERLHPVFRSGRPFTILIKQPEL